MLRDKMNKIMMLLIITSVSIANIMPALGYDANNPASYTVQYIIPSDTSFTVTLVDAETQMNFNPTNGSSKLVQPNNQSIVSNKPWANITNTGNLNLNFSTNLTASNPSWVVLYIGSSTSMADKIPATNSENSPAGWNNVGLGNTVQLYAQADFTNAPSGTTSRTIKINSKQS